MSQEPRGSSVEVEPSELAANEAAGVIVQARRDDPRRARRGGGGDRPRDPRYGPSCPYPTVAHGSGQAPAVIGGARSYAFGSATLRQAAVTAGSFPLSNVSKCRL
jgi:hypothetical protein